MRRAALLIESPRLLELEFWCDLKHILAGNKAYFGRLQKTSCTDNVCVLRCTYTHDESGNNRRCNALVPKGSRKALASGHRVAFPTKEPCIRKRCKLCESGQGHSSYALYGRDKSRRFSIYVPDELVEPLEKAVQNGRDLQKLMAEAGRRYAFALKNERSSRIRK